MASYARASGEAQASVFETINSIEFFGNGRESFRLCVTLVKGMPRLNLSKLWFNVEENRWLPTRNHFYFNKEAWETLVKKIPSLNTEIQKMGLFGMRFRFSLLAHLDVYLFKCILNQNQAN